ncbi:RdgB/HAM1 family non-canonical purine NTP pyrophosphatase [Caulobacter sp. S45]|uniref:RdgB/HAM1 family non-canonical purine NTP pyrophosphatase n=1 Tax=Caulobacter sp. S45 TaxID=1641861 RepID=UPI0015770E43|nr:RdgB/HAM1 family non-canonical purine NTP pyrophosphatase [Caulobacter sp. S45]
MTLSLKTGSRLVVATHNPGKAVEIAALLDARYETVAAATLGLPEPEETEATFMGNAVLKARAAADAAHLPAIADDSGLSVAALNGAPGVLSARWAGEPRDFDEAMARVHRELDARGAAADAMAWFTCALAVAWPEGPVLAVEGQVAGRLVFPGLGTRGFGYDPIFRPDGHAHTFGEMDPELKHAVSHRARAFAKLKAVLF